MKNVGGISGVGAPLAPDRIGGDTWIRRIGDRVIFDMHEGGGSRTRDLSGSSNDGRLTETDSLPTWERGCLSLDGIDDYICVPDSDSLTPDGGLTIEYHFRTPSNVLSSGCYKLREWSHYVFANWVGFNVEDTPAGIPGGHIGVDILPPPKYWDNEWHTFYPIWNGSTDEKNLKIYFDEAETLVESYRFEPFRTVRNNTRDVTIGGQDAPPPVNLWQVRFSFVRISSTPLSAPQVLQEYLYHKWRN